MTTTSSAKPLGLTVSNFGPISEASIELRPMSVFVGPSNTGKSYMAALIYALHQFFSEYSRRLFWNRGLRTIPPQGLNLSKDDIADLSVWARETLPGLETAEHQGLFPYELPKSIAALVHPVLNSVAHLSEDLDSEIVRCFGVDKAKNLVRYPDGAGAGFSLCGNTSTETGHNDPFELDFVQIAAQAATGRSNIHKRSSISFGNCTNSASGAEFTRNLARQIWRRTSSIQSEKVGCCFLYHAVV